MSKTFEMQFQFEIADDQKTITMQIITHEGVPHGTPITYTVPPLMTPQEYCISIAEEGKKKWAEMGYKPVEKPLVLEQINEA